jgi:transposase-like protein
MVLDHLDEYRSVYAACQAIGPKVGVGAESLRRWTLQAQVDDNQRPGVTSAEQQRIKDLEREVRDLKEANENTNAPRIEPPLKRILTMIASGDLHRTLALLDRVVLRHDPHPPHRRKRHQTRNSSKALASNVIAKAHERDSLRSPSMSGVTGKIAHIRSLAHVTNLNHVLTATGRGSLTTGSASIRSG